jgi:hypothetical protein
MSKIPQGEWSAIAARHANGEPISRIAQSYGCTPPAIHYILKHAKLRAAPTAIRASEPPMAIVQPTGDRLSGTGGTALAAGLDDDLHNRAEAAIAAFRSSFDAALAGGSPQELRRAAAGLMRVAARTTIVLDRLSAAAERKSGSAPAYPRSAPLRSWP